MSDVVVIGDGLAGRFAALAAARDGASSVGLVTQDRERFHRHDGTIDVLGYDESEPGADPLKGITTLPRDHPYRLVGTDGIREALGAFDETTGGEYLGDSTDKNALLPTAAGRLKPASRYPAGMAAGTASRRDPILLVGFESVTAFDARLVADRLDETLPYEVTGTTIEFPWDTETYPATLRWGQLLEDPPTDDSGRTVEDLFVDALREVLDVEPRVGLPAMLGLSSHRRLLDRLESDLMADFFEIPVGPPSLPGRRLEATLREALSASGVELIEGTVTGYETDGGRIGALRVETDRETDRTTVETDAVVLATGGIDSPGLATDRSGVREPVFDCHVDSPARRSEWVAAAPLDSQPFASMGLTVDRTLQVLDGSGNTAYDNLRAAGSIIGGHDYIAEQSRDGVGISTGYRAGIHAADET